MSGTPALDVVVGNTLHEPRAPSCKQGAHVYVVNSRIECVVDVRIEPPHACVKQAGVLHLVYQGDKHGTVVLRHVQSMLLFLCALGAIGECAF